MKVFRRDGLSRRITGDWSFWTREERAEVVRDLIHIARRGGFGSLSVPRQYRKAARR